jgi:hypothetical protein
VSAEASYVPGTWVAVSGPGTWLLVALPPDDGLVTRCWPLLASAAGVDDILDVLVSKGVRAAPAFALVRADERRALARGAARVEINQAGNAVQTVIGGTRAWADEEFAADADVVLLVGDPDGAGVDLPMAAGVTMACSIRVRLSSAALPPTPASAPEVVTPREVELAPVVEAAPMVDAASVVDADVPPAPSYDFLFGATQRPELPPSYEPVPATDPAAESAAEPVTGETAGWFTLPPPTGADPLPNVPPQEEAPTEQPRANGIAGLIDSLPWALPTPLAEPSAPATMTGLAPAVPAMATFPSAVVDEAPSDVSRTIDRSALAALAADSAADPPVVGPTVLAGRCPNGHLSPPHAPICRVCRSSMPEQGGFEIARPALGVLRLSTGDVVSLDRGVILGRAPEAPADAAERPHAVRLVSPENDISRTHAEVVLDGWHVYVRDLGSTNGTVVTLPSQPPLRVRAHDLQLLESGTVVTLADEVSFTFEVTA